MDEQQQPLAESDEKGAFRFYDNRQKYLMFVNTCSEKWVVSERAGLELGLVHPRPPALRVFDAGMGDGTVLTPASCGRCTGASRRCRST